jgi:hypothetical protein
MGQRPVAEWLRDLRVRDDNHADESLDTLPNRVPE